MQVRSTSSQHWQLLYLCTVGGAWLGVGLRDWLQANEGPQRTGKVDRFAHSQMCANLPAKMPEMALVYPTKSLDARKGTQKCQW
eukprot:6208104-Pleurochrysis_carterae.AAC.2